MAGSTARSRSSDARILPSSKKSSHRCSPIDLIISSCDGSRPVMAVLIESVMLLVFVLFSSCFLLVYVWIVLLRSVTCHVYDLCDFSGVLSRSRRTD